MLQDVFSQLGGPEDVAGLRCVVAWMSIRLFDPRGAALGEFEVHHEADLRCERDRLLFSRPALGPDKVYGRDGESVFAEHRGMAWPSLESRAREELDAFGILLRVPWVFADRDRFVMTRSDQDYAVNGRSMVRLRFERRPRDGRNGVEGRDRFDLICSKDGMEPQEVHMRLAATGATAVVRLADYKACCGVRIPTRRVFLSGNRQPLMEQRITRLDVRQDLPKWLFRPHNR